MNIHPFTKGKLMSQETKDKIPKRISEQRTSLVFPQTKTGQEEVVSARESESRMAMENCFQMSSVFTTRAGGPKCHRNPSSFTEKLQISTACRPFSTPSLSSTSFSLLNSKTQNSRIICKAGEALDEVKPVTESTWETQVIGNENPVLVEFWAPWCGPCKMVQPVIDELAKEYSGKISCFKVNTDESPNIATKYSIRSIPTILFFKNGEKKEGIIGAVQRKTLSDTIEKYID
ncbi:PREDICTED: thioredoxin M-type, chloroplastic-like [Tarenaya hassleriana]|uniref:thioredoxin M-type, chloroplastic-like n=1 Tax=Tarenaya hassleriana TaxID=28532 RepID=UPI0008FD59BD|nr:PREDICTED: thioredoxin M-type, chloroplastic-like [Tarenaya hassleriana]